jgi:DNA-binding NarL/FixJ family response regulator
VRTVAAGGALIDPSVARKVVAELARRPPSARPAAVTLREPLSEREQEIVRLLAQGLSNGDLADRLSLAQGTVENYVTTILQKLGARDRTQAALRAKELGLI